MLPEAWKAVVDNDNYEVSDLGRVRRMASGRGARRGHILKCCNDGAGYPNVFLYRDNVARQVRVHRLVCSAFLRLPRSGEDTNHKNGVKADNRLENLEWCTRSENIKHAYATGLHGTCDVRGEANPRAILDQCKVDAIRKRVAAGEKQAHLAREFGVVAQTIGNVVNRLTWTHAR